MCGSRCRWLCWQNAPRYLGVFSTLHRTSLFSDIRIGVCTPERPHLTSTCLVSVNASYLLPRRLYSLTSSKSQIFVDSIYRVSVNMLAFRIFATIFLRQCSSIVQRCTVVVWVRDYIQIERFPPYSSTIYSSNLADTLLASLMGRAQPPTGGGGGDSHAKF